jgi:hypothetical protein
MKESDVWLELAILIKGAPESMVYESGYPLDGLCLAIRKLYDEGSIPHRQYEIMRRRIKLACLSRNLMYFTIPTNWTNGIRSKYCLKFAKECRE